ncbi:beta-lactamase family protein [Parvularcula sp. ZS-1/3]|uniref:Beta-lactamase family protein n=1 Tax=Parvularcula mediterranea TaxID=2732508 RepID=A0A7Y3RP16_9PROT|nr:serine hydrolase domain-containing protein [Parvularcula mediterranea]NNU17530.1 beta-lactamase family protein [Parvularcula mediterranea]
MTSFAKSFAAAVVALAPSALASSEAFVDDLKRSLTVEAEEIADAFGFPGITVSVADGNGVVSVAVGSANLETGEEMTPRTTMPAASVGKTFVAAVVLDFVAEAQLSLDSPVAPLFADDAWFARLPNAETMTVRHLLGHRSGLPDHVKLSAFPEMLRRSDRETDPVELISLLGGLDPLFPAGEEWSYSDTGYLILGLIIERVTGEPFEDAVRIRFIEPLALGLTGPSNRRQLPGLARGYASEAGGLGLPVRSTDGEGRLVWNPAIEGAGGGFYSTSSDLATWGRAFLSGRLTKEELFKVAAEGVPTAPERRASRYGLGIAVRSGPVMGEAYGHRGWIPGYSTSLQYYRAHDAAIALQINTDIGIIDSDRPILMEIEDRIASAYCRAIRDEQQ